MMDIMLLPFQKPMMVHFKDLLTMKETKFSHQLVGGYLAAPNIDWF